MGVAFLFLALAAAIEFVSVFWGIGLSQGGAWLLSLACLAGMLVSIGYKVHKRWDGVLIDRDNRISLSRFQLIVWTLVVLGSLQAAGIVNMATSMAFPDDVTFPFKIGEIVVLRGPLDITIPPEIWILLGLGSFTAVAAPAIKTAQRLRNLRPPAEKDTILTEVQANSNLSSQGRFIGRVYTNASPQDAKWINLVMGDYEGAGHIDISKVQHLALTVLVVVIYSLALFELFNGRAPKALIPAFPLVSTGFLSLLGISHAAYLADKAGSDT